MKTKQRKRGERIKFPPEDRGWIGLQERVIAITGKPIEDLTQADETALTSVLRKSEKSALQNYWDRKTYDAARPNAKWEDRRCEATLGEISDFTDYVRAVAIRLYEISSEARLRTAYADVLEKIARDFQSILSRFPGAEWEGQTRDRCKTLVSYLFCQVGRLPAVEESMDIIEEAYDLLESREKELEKQENSAS